MNENGTETAWVDEEFDVDLSDILLDDGDGADQPDADNRGAEAPAADGNTPEAAEKAAEEQGAALGEAEDHSSPQEQDGKGEQAEADQPEPEIFTLKHLDTTMDVDRAKVTELAQKGLDYDRIRQQRDDYERQRKELQKFRDANADVVDFLKELADDTGMTPEQVMDELRSNQYVQKGMSPEAAKERVAREKAERRLNAATQQSRQQEREKQAADDEQRRRDEDIQAFFQSFPGVEPKDIPQEVWAAVTQGQRLVPAYREWKTSREIADAKAENQRLKAELEAAKQNNQNRQKALGSQKTVGAETVKDAFLDSLLSDE